MNLKKIKIISTLGIFATCFLSHFIYKWVPNGLFAIFFPVNESIWEHLKMMFTSILLWNIIEYILIRHYKIKYHNFLFNSFTIALTIIPIFLIMYLPVYNILGENMIITIILLFINIAIIQVLSYHILKCDKLPNLNIIGLILIIITYIVFGYLTYNPIKTKLFYDTQEQKYGINNYDI